jgi:UDP-3-O-[3-hydroxymyristoyl] N-acetylglucosamine deacetylase
MLGDLATLPQRTLKTVIGCCGVGLHTGRRVEMILLPGAPGAGIIFRRRDVDAEIPASWNNAIESPLCTALSNAAGDTIGTIEHLMAAFAGTEIDNAVVELDGPEVPIMDGSAGPFVELIEHAGIVAQDAARQAIKVLKPVILLDGVATAALFPSSSFSMSFQIDFDNPLIRRQEVHLALDPDTFKGELSRARTFGLIDDVDRLRAAGLARGGSLDNAIVVSGNHVLNRGGLRYGDEFVRHKLVDALGDLYLAGGPIVGHFRGVRSGHAHTRRLLAALFADNETWCYAAVLQPSLGNEHAWRSEPRRACA